MRTIALVLATLMWTSAAPASPTGLDLYILAGQSNISGRDVGYAVPSRYLSDPAILGSWVYNDSWHQARLKSDSPNGETRRVLVDDIVGISLSITLTIGRNAASGHPIGIVTCARGGTSAFNWREAGKLFTACIERVKEALPGNALKGLVWYQGEADRNASLGGIVRFYQRTIDILEAFRASLQTSDLPIVIVGLGDHGLPDGDAYYTWQTVQKLQREIDLPRTTFVSAVGLPRMRDGLHLSGAGQLALGTMVSAAFASIQ